MAVGEKISWSHLYEIWMLQFTQQTSRRRCGIHHLRRSNCVPLDLPRTLDHFFKSLLEILFERINIKLTDMSAPKTATDATTTVSGNDSTAVEANNSIEQPPPLPDHLTKRYESEKYPERNPQTTRQVIVVINTPDEETRDYRPHVKGAFRWWQQNSTAFFGPGNYTYSLTENASNTTVVINFVSDR